MFIYSSVEDYKPMREKIASRVIMKKYFAAILIIVMFSALAGADDTILPPGKNSPVLLIHGLGSDSKSWAKMPELLANRGYKVYVLDYNSYTWMENADDPQKLLGDLCAVLQKKLEEIVFETNKNKVNVIAHSYGGIIVRAYIAGYGVTVGPQYGFYNDIGKVVYLATPHFGTPLKKTMRQRLVQDTDYSLFKNEEILTDSLVYGSDLLNQINKYFYENKEKMEIQELSVSSLGDSLVPGYSANLDTFLVTKENRTLKPISNFNSMHVYLKSYKHSNSEVIGSPGKNLIEINDTSHPVYKICDSFFTGNTKWKKQSVKNKEASSFLVIEFTASTGFEPQKLNNSNVLLERFTSASKKVRVRLFRNKDARSFYAKKIEGGKFQLTVPVEGKKKTFKFVYNIAPGSGSILEFNPANPPFDPDDPGGEDPGEEPGDGKLPEDVTGITSLIKFVKAKYPNDYNSYKAPEDFLDLVRRVRDDLAQKYGNIERLNDQSARFGYTADYEKHADAIYIVGTNQVIDFVSGATAGGVLLDKLHWISVEPPW